MNACIWKYSGALTTAVLVSAEAVLPVVGGEPEEHQPAFWRASERDAAGDDQPLDPFGVPAIKRDWRHQAHKIPRGPASSVRIRQVTFRVPVDVDTAIRGDEAKPDDRQLFRTLGERSERGEVGVVAEFTYGALGGQTADQEVTQRFIYPSGWTPFPAEAAVAASTFETRNLGTSCSLSLTLRQDAVLTDAHLERVRWAGFASWGAAPVTPVSDLPRRCLVRMPVMVAEKMSGISVLVPGQVHLMAVQPEALVPGSDEGSVAWLYTFLRLEASAEPAPAAEGDDVVLEMISIGIPRREAAAWLTRREGGIEDGQDLTAWEKRAEQDKSLVASRWLLRAATGPVRPGGPPGATAESRGEFIYPTHFDLGVQPGKMFCPTAFETRNSGSSFSVQATWAADGKSALVKASVEDVDLEEIEQWPTRLNEAAFRIEQPSFRTRSFTCEVAVPVNGVRFIGIRNGPGNTEEGTINSDPPCDLLFLRARGKPNVIAPGSRSAPPLVEAQAAVISVPASMALQLSHETDEDRRTAALWEAHSAGEVAIIHLSAGSACTGGLLENSDILESIYPGEIDLTTSTADFIDPNGFETFNHGCELKLRSFAGQEPERVEIELEWESAPSVRPTWRDFQQYRSAKGQFPKPRFFREMAVTERTELSVDGRWHILSFKECSAPESSREHGRWHAALVRLLRVSQ